MLYSKTIEERKEHLRVVLQTLQEKKFYEKFKKCEFWLDHVIFLGHVASKDGISIDSTKVEATMKWP